MHSLPTRQQLAFRGTAKPLDDVTAISEPMADLHRTAAGKSVSSKGPAITVRIIVTVQHQIHRRLRGMGEWIHHTSTNELC